MYALRVFNAELNDYADSGFQFLEKRDAAQHARDNGIRNFKIVDSVQDDTWKAREIARFRSGQYQPVFWMDSLWLAKAPEANNHFVHLSEKQPGKIAFTESAEKGRADIQTPMSPGRYLKKYYGHVLDECAIETLANQFVREHGGSQFELRIAKDGEGIAAFYQAKKLGSCMHYGEEDYGSFSSSVHPCTVYGAGDIECATAWHEGEMVARCLIWRRDDAETLVSRIYGHIEAMQAALRTIGVETESTDSSYDSLEGARLLKIQDYEQYVIPYIDSVQCATDCGDHLKIREYGEIDSHTSHDNGGLSGHACVCDRCEDGMREDESCSVITTWGHESYCEHCADYNTFYCESTVERYSDSDFTAIEVRTRNGNTETWCEERTEGQAFHCEYNNEYYDHSYYSAVTVHNEYGHETGYACVEDTDEITLCDNSGEYYENDAIVTLENGEQWGKDIFESEGFTCYHDGLNYSQNDDEYIIDDMGNYWLFENAESDLFFTADNWHDIPDHPNSTLNSYAVHVRTTTALAVLHQYAETAGEAASLTRDMYQALAKLTGSYGLMGILSVRLMVD